MAGRVQLEWLGVKLLMQRLLKRWTFVCGGLAGKSGWWQTQHDFVEQLEWLSNTWLM